VLESAIRVGFNVTRNLEEWDLKQTCFLSTFRYDFDTPDGGVVIKRMKCLASIARNFGRATGDLPGRSNRLISDRWIDYIKGVVAGYVGEPDSLFMRSLRVKYGTASFSTLCDRCKSNTLSCVDRGIIRHYYPPDEYDLGISEYLSCVELIQSSPAFGVVIASAFIDRIMSKRYGMASVCR